MTLVGNLGDKPRSRVALFKENLEVLLLWVSEWCLFLNLLFSIRFYGMENLLNLRLTNYRKTIFK
jgi:hypothetical protein